MLLYLCPLSSKTELMLAQCLRCWPNIKPALVQRFVFTEPQSVSLCCAESVSYLFLSGAFHGTCGQGLPLWLIRIDWGL